MISPAARYLSVPHLYGRMTASRNAGLMHATGEIIAFLDDDAYAHPGWLKNLLLAYDSPGVGAVGGRALNNQPGEERTGRDQIGKLKATGFLSGNFAADPGGIIAVDHIIGCNMSFPRAVIARLGGFREDFRGLSSLCEDSDMCLRVRALGYTLLFQPDACVDHVGAPQPAGQRFNARYQYYHRRNSFLMLIRNFGLSWIVLRFPVAAAAQATRDFLRGIASASGRLTASLAGLAVGLASGIRAAAGERLDPVRHDAAARQLRAALKANAMRQENLEITGKHPIVGH